MANKGCPFCNYTGRIITGTAQGGTRPCPYCKNTNGLFKFEK
jgi:glutaredoxin